MEEDKKGSRERYDRQTLLTEETSILHSQKYNIGTFIGLLEPVGDDTVDGSDLQEIPKLEGRMNVPLF